MIERQDIVVSGVLKQDNKILLIRRSAKEQSDSGYWEFPKGKVEFKEEPSSALIREFKEEVGLSIDPGQVIGIFNHDYSRDNTAVHFIEIQYDVKLVNGERIENIVLNEAEHDQWQLVDKQTVFSLSPIHKDRMNSLISALSLAENTDALPKATNLSSEAYIVDGSRLLLGLRKNTYGAGTWAMPGGHLNYMERADECLVREIKEEMSLDIRASDMELLALTDDLQPDSPNHYLHLTFKVNLKGKVPQVTEPEFCEQWKWFELNNLPKNIFPPHKKIFETIASGKVYSSAS